MEGPRVLRVGQAAIFSIYVCGPIFAQTSWKSEHCQLLATTSDPRGPHVVVDDLMLDGTTDVAESVWNGIV